MNKMIPFSLEYRDKIESGEVKVVTVDNRPVRIVCWDGKSDFPILALLNKEEDISVFYNKEGKGSNSQKVYSLDLRIIVEDDELTEFQALLQEFANMLFENYNKEDHIIISSTLESWEKKFLEYAEDQLEKKFRAESFQQGYTQGRQECNAAWRKWYNEKMEEED